jgi:hypothetical protein
MVSPSGDNDSETQAMIERMLRRCRRPFSLLMAFLVGLPLAVACFIAGGMLTSLFRPKSRVGEFVTMAAGFIPLLLWELRCARNILKTVPRLSAEAQSYWALLLALALGGACVAIINEIFSRACSL